LSRKRSKLQLVKTREPAAAALSLRDGGASRSSVPAPRPQYASRRHSEERKTSSVLSIINLAELSEGEQLRVRELGAAVIPGAQLQGIVRGPRSWDLRPLLKQGDSLSLLRLYGPEVMLSAAQSEGSLHQLEKLASFDDSGCGLLEFGTIDSQLFVLRPLFGNTLQERLLAGERFTFLQSLGISLELIRILKRWHEEGIVHGHICPSNICFSPQGEIFLVDPGILISQHRAGRELGSTAEILDEKYSAPELLQDDLLEQAADIYCLGIVFSELFRKVKRARDDRESDPQLERMKSEDIEAISELTAGMMDANPLSRAPLDFVERVLDSRVRRIEVETPVANAESSSVAPVSDLENGEFSSWKEPLSLVDPEPKWILEGELGQNTPFQSLPAAEISKPDISEENQHSWRINPYEESPLEPRPIETVEAEHRFKEDIETIEREEKASGSSNMSGQTVSRLFVLGMLSILLSLGYKFFFRDSVPDFAGLTPIELQDAWESGIPSEMALVAGAALQSESDGEPEQQKFAERLIIKTALAGDKVSESINFPLIRLAFNEKWERKLTPADRRVVLTLALHKLVDEDLLPKDTVELGELHPGVLFAILSIQGNAPGVNQIPVSKLTALPPPFKMAFQEFINANPEAKCTDPGPLALARFWSRELAVEDVLSYLRDDTETRLRALAIMFSSERIKSRQLITMLLDHPNLRLDHELIRWGIMVKLTSWSELDSTGQLFILAGIPMRSKLSPAENVQLLAHPLPVIRKSAIDEIVNTIPLAHPGAMPFLRKLKERPEMLSGKQTIEIAQFLEKPSSATKEGVQAWCDTKPNPELLADLLSSTSNQQQSTPFDANLSLCLQRSEWQPNLDVLRGLVTHPDSLTRVWVYTKLSDEGLKNPSAVIDILSSALQTEARADLRQQIESIIGLIKSR